MLYRNEQKGNGGVIYLDNESGEVGRLTYTLFPEQRKMVISYVLVHRQFEGRGMGRFLVEEGIRFAQENSWKVEPHCSYAVSVMRRMPEVQDIML